MAKEVTSPVRKRGRSSGASQFSIASENTQDHLDVAEAERASKRVKSQGKQKQHDSELRKEKAKSTTARRGRLRKDDGPSPAVKDGAKQRTLEEMKGRKKGRKSDVSAVSVNPGTHRAEEKKKRRRGRLSLSKSPSSTTIRPKKRKEKRQTLQDVTNTSSQNKMASPRRQKQPKSKKADALEKTRPADEAEEQDETEEEEVSKSYVHIAPEVHHVRSSTIRSKWSPLTAVSLTTTSSLLSTSQNAILQRLSGTSNRQQFSSEALALLTKRINRKLARGLPFPPSSSALPAATSSLSVAGRRANKRQQRSAAATDSGRATELDFERVLDGRAALQRQLDPLLGAVDLLKREKAREEDQLEQDYALLKNLQNTARARGREHLGLLKRAHVLAAATAPAVPDDEQTSRDGDVDFKVQHNAVDSFKWCIGDEEVEPLALQLVDHVESIKGNLQQAGGIVEQMEQSRAELQNVLISQLEASAYENVMLGT